MRTRCLQVKEAKIDGLAHIQLILKKDRFILENSALLLRLPDGQRVGYDI